jgi:hypothetical protein
MYLITQGTAFYFCRQLHLFRFLFKDSCFTHVKQERLINNELQTVWKEAILTEYKMLLHHLPGGTEEKHEKPQSV